MRGYPLLTSILDPDWSGIERIRKVDALFFLLSSYEKTLRNKRWRSGVSVESNPSLLTKVETDPVCPLIE